MFYEIPATLPQEIAELETLIEKHLRGGLDATSLKAHRVPFGCYEQRKDGTYMLRVRTTGGALLPAQLEAIASLSAQYGAEAIHITTRQEFQIHDVALENVTKVMRALLTAGLSTRGGGGNTVRNIMLSPDSGVSDDEVFDPAPYAFALTSRLLAEADSWVLPRKFKITFSGSDKDTGYAQFNDVGFIANVKDGVKGFKVYVAGGMGAKPEVAHPLHEFIPAEEVYVVTAAVKRLFDKHGNRKNKHAARLRFLWNDLGEARFRQLYQQELDDLLRQNPRPFEPANLDAELAPSFIFPPPTAQNDSAVFHTWKRRYCQEQRQSGLYSVLIPAFLGNIKNSDALALARFLSQFGNDVVRASFGQNLRLRNIPEAYLPSVYPLARNISELALAPALLANSIACTGADTCKLGICLSKGALRAIASELAASGLELDQLADFKINLSGCPNTCGQHMIADLGFYGKVGSKNQLMFPAYGVVAGAIVGGGQARLAHNLARVSARDLPAFVVDVLKVWIEKKSRYASFGEYIDAEGASDVRDIAGRYHSIPNFEDDSRYYFDWGASESFSLLGKSAGECSAGLFDLIEVDFKQIDALRRKLTTVLPEDEVAKTLYGIVLSASRMLLVTRGIEAPTDAAVFNGFANHFIEAGLIDASFKSIVEMAQQQNFALLIEKSGKVLALGDAVKALYASMDNSLRFSAQAKAPVAPAAPADTVHAERDYRGVGCPMNFVKVKLRLARMKQGERLKVLLDDGPPIENVPRSIIAEGHKVLSQEKNGGHWIILIEKMTE